MASVRLPERILWIAGPVVQLGERLVRNEEIEGSYPSGSTAGRSGRTLASLISWRSPVQIRLPLPSLRTSRRTDAFHKGVVMSSTLILSTMSDWRNWQTRHAQNVCRKALGFESPIGHLRPHLLTVRMDLPQRFDADSNSAGATTQQWRNGIRARSRAWWSNPCRFKSCLLHSRSRSEVNNPRLETGDLRRETQGQHVD